MNKETISTGQLAGLILSTTVGSGIVYIPNPLTAIARQQAWISMIAAFLFGCAVLGCLVFMQRRMQEGTSFFRHAGRTIGRPLAAVAALILVSLLLFAVPAIVAGIANFFTGVMMKETPAYVFSATSLVVSALTVRAGLEVMARMFVLLAGIMLAVTLAVMLLAAPGYHLEFLMPLAPQSVKPLLHATLVAAGFPFGEVLLYGVLLPCVKVSRPGDLVKKLFGAYAVSGAMLTMSVLCTILAFGPAAGSFQYSLYRLASEVQIAEIIQRIESVIGIIMILGSYMKATVFLYILNVLAAECLGLSDMRVSVFPLALICIFLSLTMFDNPADFYTQVYVIWPFMVVAVGCSLILALTVATWVQFRHKGREGEA